MAATNNPVQFGIRIGGSPPFDRAVAVCQAAEAAGFTTLSFMDRPRTPCWRVGPSPQQSAPERRS